MNLSDIEAFLAIVETGSISSAANELFLSQSAVSNRLNMLEKKLNTKLIERQQGQRYIMLTPKGEEFIAIAKKWLSLQKDINSWIIKKTSHRLNIGSVDSLNAYLFSKLYRRIIDDKNSLALNISSHWSHTIFKLLESHELDIGLVPRLIRTNSLTSKPIFSERLVFASNPNYSKFDCCVHPEELDAKKEVYLDWGASFQIWHDSWWDPADSIEITVDTIGLILKFIDRPGAWTILPETVAHHYEHIQPLKISEFYEPPPKRICYMVMHRDPLPRIIEPIRIFESYLDKFIKKEPFLKEINVDNNGPLVSI